MPWLDLGPLPTAVPCARLHARARLAELGAPPDPAGIAELILSELATNAVRASAAIPGPAPSPLRVRVTADGPRILVEVADLSPEPPVLDGPGDDSEGGRGLVLVDALSSGWGSYPDPAAGGKVVWAEVDASPARPPP